VQVNQIQIKMRTIENSVVIDEISQIILNRKRDLIQVRNWWTNLHLQIISKDYEKKIDHTVKSFLPVMTTSRSCDFWKQNRRNRNGGEKQLRSGVHV
jgi:hypothetical protein